MAESTRADARRNRERVLIAARESFAESGFAVPLDEIAIRAGVGAGTVYRHFSTKEALFRAVVESRVNDLIIRARELADAPDAGAAFFEFLHDVGTQALAKRDVADAIELPGPMLEELHGAFAVLLVRAQHAGAVRSDIDLPDLIALLKGLLAAVAAAGSAAAGERVAAVLIDGLRASPPGSTG